MAVLLATFGAELAALWRLRSGLGQNIRVDVDKAVCQLAAIYYAKQQGVQPLYEDDGLGETTAARFRISLVISGCLAVCP